MKPTMYFFKFQREEISSLCSKWAQGTTRKGMGHVMGSGLEI